MSNLFLRRLFSNFWHCWSLFNYIKPIWKIYCVYQIIFFKKWFSSSVFIIISTSSIEIILVLFSLLEFKFSPNCLVTSSLILLKCPLHHLDLIFSVYLNFQKFLILLFHLLFSMNLNMINALFTKSSPNISNSFSFSSVSIRLSVQPWQWRPKV